MRSIGQVGVGFKPRADLLFGLLYLALPFSIQSSVATQSSVPRDNPLDKARPLRTQKKELGPTKSFFLFLRKAFLRPRVTPRARRYSCGFHISHDCYESNAPDGGRFRCKVIDQPNYLAHSTGASKFNARTAASDKPSSWTRARCCRNVEP